MLGHKKILTIVLIHLFTLTAAYRQNPLKDPQICGLPECEAENNKFDYSRKIRYKYDYQMHVRTEFSGSGDNTSDIYVTAAVILTFPSRCQGILTIGEIELRDRYIDESAETSTEASTDYFEYPDYSETPTNSDIHPKSDDFAMELQKNDLKFAFHDGLIGEACPIKDEPNWVVNFKKGILSALQNTMQRFDVDFNTTETDVSGTCEIVYRLSGAQDTSLLIQKTKDIASCTNRYKTNTILQTTPYDFRKNYAVWPILNSESYCNISVDHNVYKGVTCYERHQLVPFSNKKSGAITTSNVKLILADEETIEPLLPDGDDIESRTTLLFNHYPSPKPVHDEIKASRDLLKEMCKYGFPDIQRDFIDYFTKFLQTARLLSFSALQQLLSRASSICDNGKNHVQESLPYIASTASVELMKEQIINNHVTSDVARKWLASLSFLTRPNEDMLRSFFNLIEYGNNQSNYAFILQSTAVAHTFCRHDPECDQIIEIQDIVDYLEENVNDQLQLNVNNRKIREKIVVLLKGLGNIGVVTEPFKNQMKSLIENVTLPLDIRLQAIFSHRRLDCQNSKNYFLEIYRDFNENSEIRIAAYLQAMRCPDYVSVKYIKYVLEHEEVNQVGSYVWSHLNNLVKSASPVRVAAQGLLVDGDLGTKYKMDIRKFSRNFEHSVFFDEYNFGLLSDANLIFGTESYLPRGASFNFTADLFGESVNFFEGSIRMQGFEELVQKYFGPKGPVVKEFRERLKQASGLFSWLNYLVRDTVTATQEDDYDYFDGPSSGLRMKRKIMDNQISYEIESDELYGVEQNFTDSDHNLARRSPISAKDELKNNVNRLNYDLKYNFDEPRLAYGFKMFGNDLQYDTIEGINEIFMTITKLYPTTNLAEFFSGKERIYTKSGVFLDASYEVPLSSGLPLAIHAFGASSVDIRMSGSIAPTNFIAARQIDVEGRLKPSISVDVIATMSSDYFFGQTGVRVKSNLYSSSSIEAKLKVRGTKLVSLHISLPQDRNDIFSARSEMLVLNHENDIVQKGISKRYTNSTCTWPLIDSAVGLKICAEYSLPDVSNATAIDSTTASPDYPSLLLSGPVTLNIHLSKVDLSAKTYVFEYRWDDTINSTKGSFIFETPGSVIPRIFTANITASPTIYNVSMSFRNGDRLHSAIGTYKNTTDERRLEIYFNLDGQRNLGLEIGLNQTKIKYGIIYYPQFVLSINDENIAGLTGTLKFTDKKGVKQYDINLSFETKRLQTHVSGYITETEASLLSKLKIDYVFADSKQEAVDLEGEFANRSNRGRTEYAGALKVNASAYPQFNFASNFKLLALLGHVETKLDINNAPDLIDPDYTLTLRGIFARSHINDRKFEGSRTSASFEITRPKSNIDFKIGIKHEGKYKSGPEHNVLILLRYAPKKEVTGVFSIHLPHGTFFAIDAVMNITVPAFDSCAMGIRVIEKAKSDYNIDFQGTWFSGHSIIIKGVYQDKSTIVKTYHHLKLVVKSPHFEEINIDLRYWRDETELAFDLQAQYAKDPYRLFFKNSERTELEKHIYGELKFREKLYSVLANIKSQDPKQIFIEVHLDKLRDIHVILRGLSNELKKEAGIEVKWDANRDPTEKIAISAEFNTPQPKTYDGTFLLSYPERTFSATFDLFVGGPEYKGNGRIGWSAYEAIEINFDSASKLGTAKDMFLKLNVRTPFDGWKKNSLNAGLYYLNNLLLLNGSSVWAEHQKLSFYFMGDYLILDPVFNFLLELGVNSTIKDVPTIYGNFKHKHDNQKFDTDLLIRYASLNETTNIFSVNSLWQYDTNLKYRNLTGSLAVRSPFEGYTTGALSTKFSLSDKRQLKGAADLDIEEKKFTLSVEGHIKKFTNNMLVTNITTPLEKFRNIVGRFGINEYNKHIVADIRSSNSALGIELLFKVNNIGDFDTKFNLETPLEALEKILIVGKMKPEIIDFRGGWNKVVIGYIGVWRMVSYADFEYSYKVFTPLENFTENGCVLKFVRKENFDFEVSIKIAHYKLGIVIDAKPKPKLLRQLGVSQTHAALSKQLEDENKLLRTDEDDVYFAGKYHSMVRKDEDEEEEDEDDEDDYEDGELLNFIGNMELDTLIWPTITGTLDVDEVDDTYISYGTLNLPHGLVELRDHFYFPDYLNAMNTLRITTPYEMVKEFKSVYEHAIDFGNNYIIGIDFLIWNRSNWIEVGVSTNYTTTVDEGELKTHDLSINFKTPIITIPRIYLKTNIELEEHIYRGNFSVRTIETDFSVAGSIESDENFVDAAIALSLKAPIIPNYECKVFFKKDLSDTENSIDIGFEMQDNGTINMMTIETLWQTDRPHFLKAKGKVRTNMLPIKQTIGSILLTKSPHLIATLDLGYQTIDGPFTEFHAKSTKKKEYVTLELFTPITEFGNITLQGTLTPKPRSLSSTSSDQLEPQIITIQYNLMGNLYRNSEVYHVDGTIVSTKSDIPIDINLEMKSLSRNVTGHFTYSLTDTPGGYGKTFKCKAIENDKFIQIGGGFSFQNKLNWKIAIAAVTSNELLLINSSSVNESIAENSVNHMNLTVSVLPVGENKINGLLELITPFKHLGIDHVKIESDILLLTNSGNFINKYAVSTIKGHTQCSWSWVIMENMLFSLENHNENNPDKSLVAGIYYINPKKNFRQLNVGANLNIDKIWHFESNGSIAYLSRSDIGGNLNLRLPKPIGDIHKLSGRFRGNIFAGNVDETTISTDTDLNYEVKYESEFARTRLASRGQFRNITDMQGLLRVEWGYDVHNDATEINMLMLRKGNRREFSSRLETPIFIEDTVTVSGTYDLRDDYQMFTGKLNYPGSIQIADADVAYQSITNMKGFVNTTTPFTNLTWLKGDFDFTTTGFESIRYLKATWPKDNAFFDLKTTYSSKNNDRDLNGIIKIEVPLKTRHYGSIDYGLKERRLLTTGSANVEYNKEKVLVGRYSCKSESRAGYEKDIVDISLENQFKPIGITYIHVSEQSGIRDIQYDMKRAELYELKNSKKINITGEFHVRSTETGQEFTLIAIHPNRTVTLTSDYDYQNNTTKHKSKLQLAKSVWLAYEFNTQNLTTLNDESQRFSLQFSYPKRNLSANGWYLVTDNTFDSDISFKWTKGFENPNTDNEYNDREIAAASVERIMRGALKWRNEPLIGIDKDNQTFLLTIRHPSFQKDVTITGHYYRSAIELLKSKLIINYCDDPEHLLTFVANIVDLTPTVGYRNYSMEIHGQHNISELDLDITGSIGMRPGLYEIENLAKYKRGYLPLQEGSLNGLIDIKAKEINYLKITPNKVAQLWMKTNGSFPIYTLNLTLVDSPDVNTTGEFFINIDDKFIRLDVNLTPDASQNLRMLGEIPDARSASFDLWRDYEDIRVVDIAYFLRMNHSRLFSSQLNWRPKLKNDIKAKLRGLATSFYDSLADGIDFWIKTLYTETVDTLNDIWRNTKPYTQEFLDDVGGLRVLEDDVEEFRTFLNQSYEANDFYVKTVVNYTMTIIDELAIRNHIGSVPKILSEIWQVLGDSGQAFRRSILWLIDTIKTSYKNAVEIFTRILHGESFEQVSLLMERAVAKYDKFIKDLHLSLIKYVENIWVKMTDTITNYWKRSLQRIQPSIIKFLHYVETIIWNISKEVFDFLYKRTNELTESPYFHKVSNFTQDLDRLYKDLMANDAITNIKKYTVLAWEFLKEKYFQVVPFGKEMHDVMTELLEEIKQLKKLEPIQIVISKIQEIQSKFDWFAEQFQLEQRIHQLWEMLRNKVTRFTQTALQADDKYREAKTKFIFDPDAGLMQLEQKLPMSWHAFNETPKFEEIPEYKLLIDIQEFFNTNNFSLWTVYYEYKPYLDPNNWLPPFKSYSLIIGSRHFLTFDKKFVSLNLEYEKIMITKKPNQCSYLLAHDFFNSNFTLVLEPSIIKHNYDLISTRKLALVTEDEIIDIDVAGSATRIGRNVTTMLPIQIGESVIYRDADFIIVESEKGFKLKCNLQFDLCWFELSGWYFGKTAGLFGTMNNEQYDEYLTSQNSIVNINTNTVNHINIDNEFTDSWSLENCKYTGNVRSLEKLNNNSMEIKNLCASFFRSKLSYFVNCFSIVNPEPFYQMCLDLGQNSISDFIDVDHPAEKGTCTTALAYIEACEAERTPLRVPDICVHCNLVNGSYIPEGTFIKLEGEEVPSTSDVVFIIEAKSCNTNITHTKSFMSVVNALHKELNDINIKDNRYAVIAFGGSAPFDQPRSVVYNNQIFTEYNNLKNYFDHIKPASANVNTSSDIFDAISTAVKLIFRPGASKTFILVPCSQCNTTMKFDYSTILQVLLEENIHLHILMDTSFGLEKKRIDRVLFGIDRVYAYAKKYLKDLRGDADLHRQVHLPKQSLGVCSSLALETNGTIFTAVKLRPIGRNPIKKFASVFAKRVAITATPKSCQTCECTGHNSGFAYMTCTSCDGLDPWNLDYDENEMLSMMQAGTDFNWGDEDDEDI